MAGLPGEINLVGSGPWFPITTGTECMEFGECFFHEGSGGLKKLNGFI